MPPVKPSTKAEQVAVLEAVHAVRDKDKKRPTITDIVRRCRMNSKATRAAVGKMVREGLLSCEWDDKKEYIFPSNG